MEVPQVDSELRGLMGATWKSTPDVGSARSTGLGFVRVASVVVALELLIGGVLVRAKQIRELRAVGCS